MAWTDELHGTWTGVHPTKTMVRFCRMVRKRSLLHVLMLLSLVLGTAACPLFPKPGVTRSAQLTSMPSLECVRAAILSTPGVHDVRLEQVEIYEPTMSTNYYFIYRGTQGSLVAATLYVSASPEGGVLLGQTSPSGASQEQIDATRPVMQRIEDSLATDCGLASLPSRIREQCLGVRCS
jgi:hypothetical protein